MPQNVAEFLGGKRLAVAAFSRGAAAARKLNASWHRRHPMPKNASLDQRVDWHLEHARRCGCRAVPGTVKAELRRRGLAVPRRT